MSKTLHLSLAGWLWLAVAALLSLLALAALVAARGGPAPSRATALSNLPGVTAPVALAEGLPAPLEQATGPAAPTGINVVGEGEASGAPDVAFISLGVQTEARTAREAIDQTSAAMNAVIDAIKRAGIPENKIRTTGINLSPVHTQPRPGESAPPQIAGYRATNTVTVTVENVGRTGEVLDAGIAAGANVAGGVRFGINDDTALRRQALEEAARSARTKADALAASLGLRISGVQSVFEESAGGPVPRSEAVAAPAAGSAAPVQPGELTVRVRVRVVFSYS